MAAPRTTLLQSLPIYVEASQVPRYLSENGYFSAQRDVYDGLVSESERSDSTLRTKKIWKDRQFDLIENVFTGQGYLDTSFVGNTLHAIEATCQNGLKGDLKLVEINNLQASCLDLYRTAFEAASDPVRDQGSTIKRLAGRQIQPATVTAEDLQATMTALLQDISEKQNRIQELEAARNSVTVDGDSDSVSEMSIDF